MMDFISGLITVVFVVVLAALLYIYNYHVVCFCLPYGRDRSRQGCFINLETSDYMPPLIFPFVCTCYWLCFFTKHTQVTKIIYIYEGRKCRYLGEKTPLISDDIKGQNYGCYNTCSICLEELLEGDELIELTCRHSYHKDCIQKWLSDKHVSKCPLCNHTIYSETIVIEDYSRNRMMIGRRVYLQRPSDVSDV